jgi:hypothetical protein
MDNFYKEEPEQYCQLDENNHPGAKIPRREGPAGIRL